MATPDSLCATCQQPTTATTRAALVDPPVHVLCWTWETQDRAAAARRYARVRWARRLVAQARSIWRRPAP